MQTENWKNVKEVLMDVLHLDSSERWNYLEDADISAETREEVKSLLAFEEESGDLMHLSAVEFSRDFFDADEAGKNSLIGQRIGVYQILRELGCGGMGAVYLANRTDGKFKQQVALKLLKREMNTAALRRRFRQEREILASLEHPNIARLLDAGTTDDAVPFIAMEYVEGLPIDDYCNKHNLDLKGRLNLFRTVCSTVNFAHRNLIVHRDLKPSNILVTEEGIPKLLDFGISKILSTEIENINAATITRLGVMTPGYASPEQLRSESVTTATDIYSLGVILYELLSGHRPFETKENDLKEIYKAVIDTDPPLPSAVIWDLGFGIADSENKTKSLSNRTKNQNKETNPKSQIPNPKSLSGDLDNIVLKALKKEPERRYSSAENFSEDIKRHLDGLPVAARPDTFSYRAEKFIGRNSFSVLAGTLILLAIIGGVVATLWQARIAQAERARAEKRFNDVRNLANSFLFEFSPKIENLPGSTPARELLVTRALEYLDNLSQESAADLELQRELAKAYEKVGDVQGHPHNPNIGDLKGALRSYEKALLIRRKLLENEPDNLEAQNQLADNLGMTGTINLNGGDYKKAEGNYAEAVALRERIVEGLPQDFQARDQLARLLKNSASVPFYQSDNKKAIEYQNRALKIFEPLVNENPAEYKTAQQFANTYIDRGEARGWDEDYQGGGENIQKGLDMLTALVEKYPDDSAVRRSLTIGYMKRGENLADLEELEKSISHYDKSLEMVQNTLKSDPRNFQAKRDIVIISKQRAKILRLAERTGDAIESFKLAVNLSKELRAEDTGNMLIPYDIATADFELGETYMAAKDYDSALKTFEEAAELCRAVLSVNPEHHQSVRISAISTGGKARAYAALAAKNNQTDLWKKSLENYQAGLQIFGQLQNTDKLSTYDKETIADAEKEVSKIQTMLEKNDE